MPQFYWLWAPFHFEDLSAHIYFIDKADGTPDTVLAIMQGPEFEGEIELRNVQKKVSYVPKSRRVESMIITATDKDGNNVEISICLLYTSPSPRDVEESRMPSSA